VLLERSWTAECPACRSVRFFRNYKKEHNSAAGAHRHSYLSWISEAERHRSVSPAGQRSGSGGGINLQFL